MSTSKSILLITLCLLLANMIWGQGGFSEQISRDPNRANSVKSLQEGADKALKNGDYYNAMHRYGLVIKNDSTNVAAWYGFAEAATENSLFQQAAKTYQHLLDANLNLPKKENPRLLLANVQYRLGHYADAKNNYQAYLATEKSVSAGKIDSVQTFMDNCDWAIGNVVNPNILLQSALMLIDTPPIYDSAYVAIDMKHVNSMYSEYAPILKGDTLYFSSKRFLNEKDRNFPKRHLTKLLKTDFCADEYALVESEINEPDVHTAFVTFNEKEDRMYFCKCKYVNTFDIRCDVYRKKLNEATKQWGVAEKLSANVNIPDYTTTEPAIGRGAGQEEILYFMSDRPNGVGKKDLWYSRILGDSLTPAINLKALNTPEDDVTPFYHNGTGYLYFSTDGRQTMGGLDVYRSKGIGGSNWTEPDHLLGPAQYNTPINTGYNDVFFSVSASGSTILMASNRRGSENTSEDACCYDLYKAALLKPSLMAVTFNKKTGDSLFYTRMRLLEYSASGSIVRADRYDVAGAYRSFNLAPDKKYAIIAEKDRFRSDTVYFETPKINCPQEQVLKLYLTPCEVDLIVSVFDKNSKAKLIDCKSKFYDFGMDQTGLNKMTTPQLSTAPKDNLFPYKLEFDKNYKVVISKEGYTTDSTSMISTTRLFRDTTLRDTVYLERGLMFYAHTLNALNRDTLYGVNYYLTDLATGKILDKFVSPDKVNYRHMVTYDNRYRITATKEGYNRDSVDFTTLNLPSVAFQSITRELKLRPITIDSYLPIRLYFDNAIPSSVNFDKSPQREYRATYVDYIRRKEDFMKLYTDGLTGMELKNGQDSIDYFFEKEVRAGWDHLMAFSEVLYEMMSRGDTIEITLKGYASKLGSAAYNQALTDRRVSSVFNHFELFDGGIYKKFVNKQLFFKREANGEADWPKNVSDNVKDKKRSVYDQNASKQRRLEIIGVKTNGKRQTIGVEVKVPSTTPR
jgi:tetratricopeptide (TPR) repeat protein